MYYVYVLKSNKIVRPYIGFTSDLKQRFKYHNSGASKHTCKFLPWRLVYYEAFVNKQDAMEREKRLKQYSNNFGILKKRISRSLENVG